MLFFTACFGGSIGVRLDLNLVRLVAHVTPEWLFVNANEVMPCY